MIIISYKILSMGAFACVIPCQSVEKRWLSGGLDFRVMTTTRFLRLASELYPGVSGGFLGKVWLACLLREDFKIFPAMPSTN